MVSYEQVNEKQIRAYSDNNKYLNEYDSNGNLLVEGKYVEAINYGKIVIVNGEKIGIFDNGRFYKESEIDIPIIEEVKETNEV